MLQLIASMCTVDHRLDFIDSESLYCMPDVLGAHIAILFSDYR